MLVFFLMAGKALDITLPHQLWDSIDYTNLSSVNISIHNAESEMTVSSVAGILEDLPHNLDYIGVNLTLTADPTDSERLERRLRDALKSQSNNKGNIHIQIQIQPRSVVTDTHQMKMPHYIHTATGLVCANREVGTPAPIINAYQQPQDDVKNNTAPTVPDENAQEALPAFAAPLPTTLSTILPAKTIEASQQEMAVNNCGPNSPTSSNCNNRTLKSFKPVALVQSLPVVNAKALEKHIAASYIGVIPAMTRLNILPGYQCPKLLLGSRLSGNDTTCQTISAIPRLTLEDQIQKAIDDSQLTNSYQLTFFYIIMMIGLLSYSTSVLCDIASRRIRLNFVITGCVSYF